MSGRSTDSLRVGRGVDLKLTFHGSRVTSVSAAAMPIRQSSAPMLSGCRLAPEQREATEGEHPERGGFGNGSRWDTFAPVG